MIVADFHGVAFRLDVSNAEVEEALRGDFKYFEASDRSLRPMLHLEVLVGSPAPPVGRKILRRGEYEAYDDGPIRHIDFRGDASARWDYKRKVGIIIARTVPLARELAHLAVLSRAGEELDRRGLHRVHALGVAQGRRGALILMGSGGGKSVLAMEALRSTGLGIISDDSPVVTGGGQMLAFPLRVGLRGKEFAQGVPSEMLSEFPRRGRPTKTMVALEFFSSRIPASVEISALLLGRRGVAGPPVIRRASRIRALLALADAMVVGRGVAQMSEYVLRAERSHLMLWADIGISRLRAAVETVLKAPAYDFVLSGNARDDVRVLEEFLSRSSWG